MLDIGGMKLALLFDYCPSMGSEHGNISDTPERGTEPKPDPPLVGVSG